MSDERGPRSRTRRAILTAAVSVLARDRAATLADVAEAAGVGRSTLHRYFPDREELITAVVQDSLAVIQKSIDEADLGRGPAVEAMHRLVAAMLDVAPRLRFLWGDPSMAETVESTAPDGSMMNLIKRGQAEQAFDPALSPDWIQTVLWALVHTGVEQVDRGRLPRHGAYTQIIRTLENGIRPREP